MTRRRIPLRDLIARGPVLSPREAERFVVPLPSGARYTGARAVPFPVLPLQVFGVPYDLDLVVVDDHPAWDMHELARVRTPDGPVWLCKDSRSEDLAQSIVADHPEVLTVLPEVPLARRRGRVEVDDARAPHEVRVSYDNDAGERVEVALRGGPLARQRQRNASTMGHSSDAALAVLDLSHRAFCRGTVRIAGVERRVARILGIVPFTVALAQTQGGFSAGTWSQGAHGTSHAGVAQAWRVEDDGGEVVLVQEHRWRTLRFVFRRDGDALELARAEVRAYGLDAPACVAWFSPCLPDVARPLAEPVTVDFRLDVGGQVGHGRGSVTLVGRPGGIDLRIEPSAPRWLADRALHVRIDLGEETVVCDARVVRSPGVARAVARSVEGEGA